MRRTLTLSLLTFLLAVPADAEDAADADLVACVEALFAETDPAARAGKGLALAATGAGVGAVAAAVERARRWDSDAPKGDVVTWKRETPDGVAHTIYAQIPETYDPARAWPVLIWLHGGVSREQDEGGLFGIRIFGEAVDEDGFILLSPSTQQGAEWWTTNGVELVRGSLEDLQARWRVDADRVAVSGFSDGASGCFHLLSHDPGPYCCFLPLMGHPGLTRLIGGPCFAANVGARPVWAVNGGQDPLYASARMEPLIDQLKQAGCDVTWNDLPEAGHRIPHVLPEHWPAMRAFWRAHPREALPRRVTWATARPREEGRLAWVEILGVDAKAPSDATLESAVLPDPPGRPRLGIRLDQEHRGAGLAIEAVQPGTAAAEAGFQPGDVIVDVDGEELGEGAAAFGVLSAALGNMQERAGVFTVRRGEAEVELTARPRSVAPERPPGLGYGAPSASIDARVAQGGEIHVRTRHVARFKLHLAPPLVDLARPIRVVVNGKERFEGKVAGSVGHLLNEAVRAGPGAPLYHAVLVIAP
jgi:hypothetical protein